jgi:hypothetical protein
MCIHHTVYFLCGHSAVEVRNPCTDLLSGRPCQLQRPIVRGHADSEARCRRCRRILTTHYSDDEDDDEEEFGEESESKDEGSGMGGYGRYRVVRTYTIPAWVFERVYGV